MILKVFKLLSNVYEQAHNTTFENSKTYFFMYKICFCCCLNVTAALDMMFLNLIPPLKYIN